MSSYPSQQGSGGNVIAALCNVFFPGLGHLVQGRLLAAAFIFIFCAVGYWLFWLVVPAIAAAIVHLWAIISAARYQAQPRYY
jgi:TM2 domain-containing membrane protein YozV